MSSGGDAGRPGGRRRAARSTVFAVALALGVGSVLTTACSGSSPTSTAPSTTRATASTTPPPPAGVAMQVNDWQLSRATLDDWLGQVGTNNLYLGSWQAANGVSPRRDGSPELSDDFVASFLNEQLSFQVAHQVLDQRGVTLTDADRADATRRLGEGVAAGAGAGTAGAPSTPTPEEAERLGNQMLDGFGSYGPVLRDGVAALIAVRNQLGGSDREQALRALFDENRLGLTEVCISHILVATAGPTGGPAGTVAAGPDPSGSSEPGPGAPGTTAVIRDAGAATARAQEAKAKLDSGIPMASVAAEYSDDEATRPRGGDVGCVSVGQLDPALGSAVRDAPIGSVVGPITTASGAELVVVRSRRDPGFDEVRDRLARAYDQGGSDALVQALESAMRRARLLIDPSLGWWDPSRATIVAPSAAGAPRFELTPDSIGAAPGSVPVGLGPAGSTPGGPASDPSGP